MGAQNTHEQWRLLDPVVLARVFTFLDIEDRIQAGSTCRHWRQVFNLPVFFREKTVTLGGHDEQEEEEQSVRAVRYIEHYASHMIHCKLDIATVFTKPVEDVLTSLASAPAGMKLQTLSVDSFIVIAEGFPKDRIVKALSHFLTIQSPYLQKVSVEESSFSLEEGCQIVEALATHNKPSLTPTAVDHPPAPLNVLELHDFFRDEVHAGMCPKFTEVMGGFRSLRNLTLDFLCITDDTLAKLSSGSPFLEKLCLNINRIRIGSNLAHLFPSSEGWRTAVQNCPQLKAFLDMDCVTEIQRTLVPGIPIVSLFIIHLYPEDLPSIPILLGHVSQHFAGSLELLTFACNPARSDRWSWPSELEELVTRCPFLTCLSFHDISLPLDTLMQVAAARPKSTSSLPAPVKLEIHLGKGNRNIEYRALGRLSAMNTNCAVKICPED